MGDFNAEKKKRMKPEFLTELSVKEKSDGVWELQDNLVYNSKILGLVTVPKGFVTDFASVPRVPIAYMFYGDRAHREAVVHDFLYQNHVCSKHTADRVFMEAMKARKKSFLIRWPMYLGVVLGGQSSYNSGPERLKINK